MSEERIISSSQGNPEQGVRSTGFEVSGADGIFQGRKEGRQRRTQWDHNVQWKDLSKPRERGDEKTGKRAPSVNGYCAGRRALF